MRPRRRRCSGAHLGLWAEIGKITLETYLLQHHIWLTSNAKTVLVWVPWSPKLNLALTSVVYVFCSRRLYRLTLSLRAMLLPVEPAALGLWCANLAGVVGASLVAAKTLELTGAGLLGIMVGVLLSAGIVAGLVASAVQRGAAEEPRGRRYAAAPRFVCMRRANARAMQPRVAVVCVSLVMAVGGAAVWAMQTDPFPSTPAAAPSLADCLKSVGDGAWTSGTELCAPSGAFAVCTPRMWRWGPKATACGFSRVAKLPAGKVQFWGGAKARGVFLALARLDNPAVAYPATNTAKVETYGSVEYHPGDAVDAAATAQASLVVIESGPASLDSKAPVISLAGASAPVYAKATVDFNKLATGADASENLGGGAFTEVVYDVAAQQLLNAAKGPATAKEPAKGSGGGVAHDPQLGLMMIALTVVMLAAMDGFLGANALFYRLLGKRELPVTWAASVAKLHASIGIHSKARCVVAFVGAAQRG